VLANLKGPITFDWAFQFGVIYESSKRSEKSPYGTTSNMAKEEIDMLFPAISMPISKI